MNVITIITAILIIISPFYFKNYFSKSHIASLTITLGIFGTFLGVFLGLLDFDSNNITGSIPPLLNGLKLAFLTSISGLLTNIILRIKPEIYGIKESVLDAKNENVGEAIVKELRRVSYSIVGDGESTMVTQLQKLRTTNSDGFSQMAVMFKEFADQMVADSTQSLIDALTQVMQDFNTKINEQFGENFKQLNEAVKNMLVWQQEYKGHVELMVNQFNLITTNIEKLDDRLENTAQNNKVIYETNQQFNILIKDFSAQVNSFAELGNKAKDSLPLIERNMEQLTSTSEKYIKDNLEKLGNSYDSFSKTQNDMILSYQNNIDQMIKSNADRVQKLDAELGEELNKSLESLGKHLTSLSQHFVKDYQPLTESLSKLIKASNQQ